MDNQENIETYVIEGFNPEQLYGKGFALGSIDLIEGGSFEHAVGRSICALLLKLRGIDGRPVFPRATIILPPMSATVLTEESVHAAFRRAVISLRGFDLDDSEVSILRRSIRIVNSPSLEIAAMMEVVQKQETRCLVAIADAHMYRDFSIELAPVIGISEVRTAEAQWVPHVAAICQRFVPIVKTLDGYGLIHSATLPAQNLENQSLLNSVDDCYVSTLHFDEDPIEKLTLRAQSWKSMVLQGKLAEVKAEIATLGLAENTRLGLLAQLLQGTGHDGEVIDIVTQLRPYLGTLQGDARIQLAKVAHNAGDDELAKEFLPDGLEDVREQLWLEEGLELVTQLEDDSKISAFDARVAELLPHSDRLRENRDRRLLMNCWHAMHQETHLFTTSGFTENHLTLQAKLSVPTPDYQAILDAAQNWGEAWLELAVVCCAVHAQSADKPIDAALSTSRITMSKLYGRQATQILLSSLRKIMLQELISDGNNDHLRDLFKAAFRFLSLHPQDSDVRVSAKKLLEVESSGAMGIPLITLTMLDLAEEGVRVAKPDSQKENSKELIQGGTLDQSIKIGLKWLLSQGAAEPGVTILPRELLIEEPDDVVLAIEKLIDYGNRRGGEDVDLQFMQKLVLLACAICPHATTQRDQDIRLIRQLACQLAMTGKYQQARNFAEAVLLIGQTSLYRRRLAWQAFADIYHRCRNQTLALLGMACALAVDIPVKKTDLWHEIYTIHRALRDVGLYELSRSFLPVMKVILSDLGYDADKDPMYLNAVLGLQVMEESSFIKNELLNEIADACQRELSEKSRLFPLTMLLAQAVLKAESFKQKIPSNISTTLDSALSQLGESMAEMVRTMSKAKPRAQDVLTLFSVVERAEFASDIASDFSIFEQSTRRLLNAAAEDDAANIENIFATELLADHSVSLAGIGQTMTVEWPAQYAATLNQEGVDVAFLALDIQGELTVTHASDGKIQRVEQPREERNFRHRFQSWLQNYPREYGLVDSSEGSNVFILSMEALNVRLPQCEKLLLVAEPFLQQLTANLVLVSPEGDGFPYFAGIRAAVGIVPSLTWLRSATFAKRGERTEYKAWISAEENSGFFNIQQVANSDDGTQVEIEREATLDIALSRLRGCFDDFGFSVDTGRRLPRDMGNASVAVVTAHGGLNREGRYLHSISDDDKLLVAPSALAAALAGVELVILFVCSGGRIDKNPWDNSTTSLPKQLLNKGCRAVIASPWPLNVMVTYNWLPVFMSAWNEGASVLDATKMANDEVAQRLGDAPQYSLAMRAYGNVLLKKEQRSLVSGG